MLASDWFSLLLTGKATADNGVAKGMRAQQEMTSPEPEVTEVTSPEPEVTGNAEVTCFGVGNR